MFRSSLAPIFVNQGTFLYLEYSKIGLDKGCIAANLRMDAISLLKCNILVLPKVSIAMLQMLVFWSVCLVCCLKVSNWPRNWRTAANNSTKRPTITEKLLN